MINIKKILYVFGLMWISLSSNALVLDLLSCEMEPCELDPGELTIYDDAVLELCDFEDFNIAERGIAPNGYHHFARMKAKVVLFKNNGKYFIFQIQRNPDESVKRVPFNMSGKLFYWESKNLKGFAIRVTKEGSKVSLKIEKEKLLADLLIHQCKECNIEPIAINIKTKHLDFQSWFIIPIDCVNKNGNKLNSNSKYIYNSWYEKTEGILVKGLNSDTGYICKFNGPKSNVSGFAHKYYGYASVNNEWVKVTNNGHEIEISS